MCAVLKLLRLVGIVENRVEGSPRSDQAQRMNRSLFVHKCMKIADAAAVAAAKQQPR
jgi:hypothetical protein